ncbi:hypothetical protein R1sor_018190 [Riccia sorocarpa]|uniref:HNH homing endonuclease n=1 Tax=Riccia sorocarpa TaxID=122646 RepID=A0ABD3I8Z4_9MARC
MGSQRTRLRKYDRKRESQPGQHTRELNRLAERRREIARERYAVRRAASHKNPEPQAEGSSRSRSDRTIRRMIKNTVDHWRVVWPEQPGGCSTLHPRNMGTAHLRFGRDEVLDEDGAQIAKWAGAKPGRKQRADTLSDDCVVCRILEEDTESNRSSEHCRAPNHGPNQIRELVSQFLCPSLFIPAEGNETETWYKERLH